MSRRTAIVLVVALGVTALVAFTIVRDRSESLETAEVTRGSIDVTIQTVGSIQAPDAAIVRTRVSGVLETFGAEVGDVVTSGDILAILDQEPFERAILEAHDQLTQAEFALQLAERRASDESDNEDRRFEVLAAADRVVRAERALSDAREQVRRSVITAPLSGTVIELQARIGDAVGSNQPLARIATDEHLRLLADVDELDLPNVVPGADVRFRLDAYPAVELEGTVLTTAPTARQQGGATVFTTTIAFNGADDLDVRPGMNADVTIVTEARDDVLLIPESALRTVGSRSFVVVADGGDEEEREVTLGYRGAGQVEVVAGLSEGERVIMR